LKTNVFIPGKMPTGFGKDNMASDTTATLLTNIKKSATLEDIFTCLAPHNVYYLPNPGNGGDAIIAAGTYEVAARQGCQLTYVPRSQQPFFDASGKIVLYGGGGNLVEMYTACRSAMERFHKTALLFVVLPQTVSGNADLLPKLGDNVVVICRERYSYDYVRNIAPGLTVLLMHDAAFYYPIRLKSLNKIAEGRVAFCFRTDGESTGGPLPPGNVDISSFYPANGEHRDFELVAARLMLSYLNGFQEIFTDRLHVAIAGALLGKKVYLYPNSYYKNRAVYEYSLQGNFPNVHWMEPDNRSAAPDQPKIAFEGLAAIDRSKALETWIDLSSDIVLNPVTRLLNISFTAGILLPGGPVVRFSLIDNAGNEMVLRHQAVESPGIQKKYPALIWSGRSRFLVAEQINFSAIDFTLSVTGQDGISIAIGKLKITPQPQ
jgi:exopolysaccharide biosynthesis predicted pyruvyltransferase EpsI